MERPEVKLGDRAKDKISGFEGIVCAITNWISGCKRITISPEKLKDGVLIDNCSFDIEMIEVINPEEVTKAEPSGGPEREPVRSADPK